jgi:hypothetical protein
MEAAWRRAHWQQEGLPRAAAGVWEESRVYAGLREAERLLEVRAEEWALPRREALELAAREARAARRAVGAFVMASLLVARE